MIGIEEFAERIIRLGAGWQRRPWPRKRLDRQVLMKSIVMTLDSSREYTEAEVNRAIMDWNAEIAPAIRTDYVNIRRTLVDYGHLERTPDGTIYRVGFPANPLAFELDVDDLDQRATVTAYRDAHPRRSGPPSPEPEPG